MKLSLKSIKLNYFRGFDNNQEYIMPDSHQIIGVVGKNLDAGGSNGSNKSSFVMATLVNLFGPKAVGISTKNLKNRKFDHPASVVCSYEIDGKLLTVDRILGGKLSVVFDVEVIEGKVDDVQSRLESILKINLQQLKMLSNRPQKERGGFLLMDDAKKKEFLGSFFDAEFLEAIKDNIAKEIKELEVESLKVDGAILSLNDQGKVIVAKKQQLEINLQIAMTELDKINPIIEALEGERSYKLNIDSILADPDILNLHINSVDAVKNAVKRSQDVKEKNGNVIKDLLTSKSLSLDSNASLKSLLKDFQLPKTTVDALADKKRDLIELKSIKDKISVIKTRITIAKANEMTALNSQLGTALFKDCSSCGAPLSEEKKAKILAEIALDVKVKQDIVLRHESDLSQLPKDIDDQISLVESEIRGLEAELTEFKTKNSQESTLKQISSNEQLIRSFDNQLAMLETEIKASEISITQLKNQEIKSLELIQKSLVVSIMQKEREIAEKSTKTTKIRESIESVDAELINLDIAIDEKNKNKSAISRKQLICQKSIEVTSKNGFISYLFDSILEDLNKEINLNLKHIPNAKNFSLLFSPDKIIKTTKELTKTISYTIYNGSEKVELETLSGGEELSVIIAVDEAIDSVVSEKLGVKIGWKFLDEQFSWIDENSKEAILDFYRMKSVDKTYFIVDHASEFNASLEHKITIIKENDIARVFI